MSVDVPVMEFTTESNAEGDIYPYALPIPPVSWMRLLQHYPTLLPSF